MNAALANGIFGHADETDDSHPASMTHPGSAIVPAALAMAERDRHDGTALLRAVVLGYDLCARLTLSLGTMDLFLRGHHPPCFGDLFGAAAAAGALARLDPQQVRYLLSYTAQQAAGLSCLFTDPEHMEKAFDMSGMHDINMQHLVALMLLDGQVTFKSSHDFKRMRDPRVLKVKECRWTRSASSAFISSAASTAGRSHAPSLRGVPSTCARSP